MWSETYTKDTQFHAQENGGSREDLTCQIVDSSQQVYPCAHTYDAVFRLVCPGRCKYEDNKARKFTTLHNSNQREYSKKQQQNNNNKKHRTFSSSYARVPRAVKRNLPYTLRLLQGKWRRQLRFIRQTRLTPQIPPSAAKLCFLESRCGFWENWLTNVFASIGFGFIGLFFFFF